MEGEVAGGTVELWSGSAGGRGRACPQRPEVEVEAVQAELSPITWSVFPLLMGVQSRLLTGSPARSALCNRRERERWVVLKVEVSRQQREEQSYGRSRGSAGPPSRRPC